VLHLCYGITKVTVLFLCYKSQSQRPYPYIDESYYNATKLSCDL
jgi:hypothetical protein